MEDTILSEVRAILRTNLGPFETLKENDSRYEFRGDNWSFYVERETDKWSVLLKQDNEDVEFRVVKKHEIPTVVRECVTEYF